MAYRPPGLAPVLGLGQVKEQEDDEPSFARFGDLLPELKNIGYKHYCVDLGLIYSCEYRYDDQPALLRQSAELRAEALPVFYSHSTFLAEVDIWPPPFEGEVLPATLDKCTKDMMLELDDTNLCRIKHLSLNVEFDMEPWRRFVITFDLTQWDDFDRAIRIERTLPTERFQYDDTFKKGIQTAIRLLFDIVPRRPYLQGRPRCDDVLETAEELLDVWFHDNEYWEEEAFDESLEAARNYRRRVRFELLKRRVELVVALLYVQALLMAMILNRAARSQAH
jgi:hypothetical protein